VPHTCVDFGAVEGDARRAQRRSFDEPSTADHPQTDDQLARQIRAGSTGALGELYDRYAAQGLAVAIRVLGSREEAEDVVHDAFVAVWRKIDRFDADRGSLRGWLMTVIRNRSIDRLRSRRPAMDIDDADERALLRSGVNPTWEAALRRTSAADVRAVLDELPDDQRRAVELAYFEGYTYREVAERTGVPPGTASGRLRLALAKLRDALSGTAAAPLPVEELARDVDR
jgi:RNA polymerase sigma-70 factor (ECF subfamily)